MHRTRPVTVLLICLALVCTALVTQPCLATSIVILRGQQQVYIGADSRRTYWKDGKSYRTSVCKIVTAGNLVFAASGITVVGGTQVADIGRDALLRGQAVPSAIEAFRLKMLDYLPSALRAREQAPSARKNQSELVLEAAFASVTAGSSSDSAVAVEWFRSPARPGTGSSISDRRSYSDQLYGRYEYIFLGQRGSIDRYLARNSTAIHSDEDARRLITYLIRLEIADAPAATAEPIDIVKLTSTGLTWLQRKSGCE